MRYTPTILTNISSILWSETWNFHHQCVTVPSVDGFLLSLLINLKSNKTKLDSSKLKNDNEGVRVCVSVCVCVRVRERGAHTGCVVSLETDNKTVIEDLPSSAWRPTENHFFSFSLFSSSSSSSIGHLSLSLSLTLSLSLFLALSRFTSSSPSSPLG